MKNEDIIRKIKKLIAIAGDPSASDQEIQLAAYRARKLMLQDHIEEYELYDMQENKDVVQIVLQRKSSGYAHWVLRALSEAFRCKSAYRGKINTNQCTFVLTGLKNDIEILRPLAEGILYYLDSAISDLQECYIGDVDFRVFKRNYYDGFSDGLKKALDRSLLEMNINEKYELAIVGIPEAVTQYYASKTKMVQTHFKNAGDEGYALGYTHGKEYDVNRKDLIEGE